MIDAVEGRKICRAGAGLFDLTGQLGLVKVTGPDRLNFLQSLTSNDLSGLEAGEGQGSAILDKRSGVLADLFVCNEGETFWIVTSLKGAAFTAAHLESLHFAEDVVIQDASAGKSIFALQGPEAPRILQEAKFSGLEIPRSLTGDEGYLLAVDSGAAPSLVQLLTAPLKAALLDPKVLESLRIEAGLPMDGIDSDPSILLLELDSRLERVNFDKGCFPGQEIVARIKSRGEVKQKLMGLVFEGPVELPLKGKIQFQGVEAGELRSSCFYPERGQTLALAYLSKPLSKNPGTDVDLLIGGRQLRARVAKLPFYVSQKIAGAAHQAYGEGMLKFHAGDLPAAALHFEAALRVKPDHADACEALAVTVEKQGDLERAIRLNKRFTELDPDAVMGYTNLSRLYMLKGWKEKAEEEQSKATMVKLRQASRGAQPADLEKERAAREASERESKHKIFTQVLAMDPLDEVANFGIGKIYLDGMQYEKSVQHFRTVVQNNPVFSAAYEHLGTALMKLGRASEAAEVFTRGSAAAESKGDLMPLQAMRRHLKALTPDLSPESGRGEPVSSKP